MRNELDKETSPYLLQHANNPVHWQSWAPETLAAAKAEGKPILLSVGYAACHWCHVMAHESFEDSETARVMNSHFVNIKVDREERPDIDALYQNALALLGEHGGWPLTMFLTPEGAPFWGGTYFPPEAKYGRPGFKGLLEKVADVYRNQSDAVTKNVETMQGALKRLAEAESGEQISCAVADRVADRLLKDFDPIHGGIGTAPKFPHCTIFELVYRSSLRTQNKTMSDAVQTSLSKICQGGIYDHLGGGFARYSTDAMWLVPHFEKMLYDNAQLIDILLLAWLDSGNPLFAARIRETAAWVLREMVADGGGFAATLDADSEGEEGRFYVWSESEIDSVLGTDAGAFKTVYGVNPYGNWEGKCILNRIENPALGSPEAEAALAEARARLLTERAKRVRPGWDDKVLADWNGLMIASLARAGLAMGEAAWLTAARSAFDFVCARLARPDDPRRLGHSTRGGKLNLNATLDDYAAMARAALALFEVTGEPVYLERAETWAAVLDDHYAADFGGYYFTADDAEGLFVRTRSAADAATPSGNGMMVGVLARLWLLTGNEAWRASSEKLVRAFSGELERNVFPLATLINASALLERGVQVAIIGRRGDAATDALVASAFNTAEPDLVLHTVAPGAALPELHPARAKDQVDGKPTAYVCVGTTCSLPLTDPDELADAIARA